MKKKLLAFVFLVSFLAIRNCEAFRFTGCLLAVTEESNGLEVDDIESLFEDLGGMPPPPPPQPASAAKAFFRKIGLAVLMRGLSCKRWCIDSVQAVINYIKNHE